MKTHCLLSTWLKHFENFSHKQKAAGKLREQTDMFGMSLKVWLKPNNEANWSKRNVVQGWKEKFISRSSAFHLEIIWIYEKCSKAAMYRYFGFKAQAHAFLNDIMVQCDEGQVKLTSSSSIKQVKHNKWGDEGCTDTAGCQPVRTQRTFW